MLFMYTSKEEEVKKKKRLCCIYSKVFFSRVSRPKFRNGEAGWHKRVWHGTTILKVEKNSFFFFFSAGNVKNLNDWMTNLLFEFFGYVWGTDGIINECRIKLMRLYYRWVSSISFSSYCFGSGQDHPFLSTGGDVGTYGSSVDDNEGCNIIQASGLGHNSWTGPGIGHLHQIKQNSIFRNTYKITWLIMKE